MLAQLVSSYAGSRVQIEFDWLAGQMAMAFGAQKWAQTSLLAWLAAQLGITTAEETAAATKTATATAATAATIAASKAQAFSEIPAYTGVASMAAASSVAGIPVVGPALAAAAFAQMQALGVSALGMASLDVGTNVVPNDMIAQIHAGERVMPAADNRDLMAFMARGMGGGRDRGGDTHLHYGPTINGREDRGLGAMMRTDSREFLRELKRLNRNGALKRALAPA
jgi:hypothetical protein